MSETDKMLAGEWYDANYDPQLVQSRREAADNCFDYDHTRPSDVSKREEILKKILHTDQLSEGLEVLSPFLCDYGYNIHLGNHVFVGHDCYFMDGAKITVGDNVFIGPSCGFYTAVHPMNYADRNKGLEKALPVTIGDNCWLGAGVRILPGVHIGNGCVIAAGSVVTKDIEDNSLAAGVPAVVKKKIDQNERVQK